MIGKSAVHRGRALGSREGRGGFAPLTLQPVEFNAAALQPAQAALHRRTRRRMLRTALDQFVELHDHIGAKIALDLHHPLGRVVVA